MSGAGAKIRIAEQLLLTLATELRFVPIQGGAKRTHLRALELKRELRSWEENPPDDEGAIDRMLDELQQLWEEACSYRKTLLTGKELTRPIRPLELWRSSTKSIHSVRSSSIHPFIHPFKSNQRRVRTDVSEDVR